MNKLMWVIFLLHFSTCVNAYETEDKLKVIITGKIAEFISWGNNDSSEFLIGVYKNHQLNNIFDTVYNGTQIKSKKVEIEYIKNIKKLQNLQEAKILYISQVSSAELTTILRYIKNKNILTISDMRGFAQKGGMIQLYTKNQRLKLRINLDNVKKENIKIKASLLRISDVIRKSK